MKLVRVLLGCGLVAASVGVSAPSAYACFSESCIVNCVEEIADGDLRFACRL